MLNQYAKAMIAVSLVGLAQPTFAERNPNDPYEKYNRAMYQFNDKADRYVFQPIARTYKKVTPQPVRTAASNFTNNLRDVVSFGSNILRGDLGKAGNDFMRVSLNSTFGLGGLINWADAAGMPDNKNHLGDTFATWGWKNSHYFVYPLTGPSTVRDSVGSTITAVASPNQLIFRDTAVRYSVTAVGAVETRAKLLGVTDNLDQMALDKYAYTRDIYMAYRNKQVGNTAATQPEDEIDDLFSEEDEQAAQKNRGDEENANTAPPSNPTETPQKQPESPQSNLLELKWDEPSEPLKLSDESREATQQYIDLWQHQAQNNTAFY